MNFKPPSLKKLTFSIRPKPKQLHNGYQSDVLSFLTSSQKNHERSGTSFKSPNTELLESGKKWLWHHFGSGQLTEMTPLLLKPAWSLLSRQRYFKAFSEFEHLLYLPLEHLLKQCSTENFHQIQIWYSVCHTRKKMVYK